MNKFSTKQGRPQRVAWIEETGVIVDAGELGREIREFHKELVGQPALKQIEGLGLMDSFNRGWTPHQMPASFC